MRWSQFLWIISLVVGGFTVVYYFAIREDQLPLIADAVRAVGDGRPDDTYTAAADIVFWAVFWVAVAAIILQIALLVSFLGRRARVRWWQFAVVLVQGTLYLLSLEVVAVGERGSLLGQLFLLQTGLALLALLISTFSPALAWTARKHDVRRAGAAGEF